MVTVSFLFLLFLPFLPLGIPMGPVTGDTDLEGKISHSVIVFVTLLAGFLLVLNVVLITCYVKRKRRAPASSADNKQNGNAPR